MYARRWEMFVKCFLEPNSQTREAGSVQEGIILWYDCMRFVHCNPDTLCQHDVRDLSIVNRMALVERVVESTSESMANVLSMKKTHVIQLIPFVPR